jgi:Tfp pilus assembly protein PilV
MSTNKKIKIKNSGFTLVETLVAIFIFSFSILGIIVITGQGVGNVQYAKNRLIASYLAQEGIELVRNVRDTTVLTSSWTDFTDMLFTTNICDASPGSFGCNFDQALWLSGANPFTPCNIAEDCMLSYSQQTGYTADSNAGDPTKFSRSITTELIPMPITGTDDQVHVVSTVSWTQGSSNTTYSVKAEENLFNWIAP